MNKERNSGGLDYFRIVAAFMVIAIHTSPLTTWNADADFFLTRILARTAVPFFFMATGDFVLSGLLYETDRRAALAGLCKSVRKTAALYGIAIVIYIPVGIYAGHYTDLKLTALLRMLFFDGTFYHLWYFPACMLGLLLVFLFSRTGGVRFVAGASFLLYIVGLFGDSYYGLAAKLPLLAAAYEKGFSIWSYTRNGIFFAPFFMVLGAIVGRREKSRAVMRDVIGLFVSFGLMTAEAFTLRRFDLQRHDSMYLMLIPTMICLYRVLAARAVAPVRQLRVVALWMYILHPAFIIVVRAAAKLTGLMIFMENSLCHYCAVALLSAAAAWGIAALLKRRGRRAEPVRGRAWIELDDEALEHNVRFFEERLPLDVPPAVCDFE